MKTVGRSSLPFGAGVAGAVILLSAGPQFASAQAVDSFLRPGGRPAASAPAPTRPVPNSPAQPAPQFMPLRSGPIFGRPLGFSEPLTVNRSMGNSSWPSFQNVRPTGPTVVVPDAADTQGRGADLRYHGMRPVVPVGPANGFFNNSTPPVGPGNGFFNNSTPPVGPANGYFNSNGVPSTRTDGRNWRDSHDGRFHHDDGNSYVYNTYPVNSDPIIAGAPPLLGGYYYGNYCDISSAAYTYPSVYGAYDGFPPYIFSQTVVIGQPYVPVYGTSYLPFYTPIYPVTYNQNNYYVTTENRVQDLEAGGDRAQAALPHAYPANSYQAAFGDIARAWMDSSITPLRKHIRDSDTRVSVYLNTKYSYSIASGDFVQITRDALNRLNTVSFTFTRLRKARNGEVTAYGTHVYRVEGTAAGDGQDGAVVPFDQSGSDQSSSDPQAASPYDKASDPAVGAEKTMYVSYTLRHRDTQWYIIAVDSSDHDLVPVK